MILIDQITEENYQTILEMIGILASEVNVSYSDKEYIRNKYGNIDKSQWINGF